jgi:hypothetical protein
MLATPWLPAIAVEAVAIAALLLVVAFVVARPQRALWIFVVGLPLHNLMMAYLFARTGSVPFVKLMQPWKELVVALALARVVAPMAYRTLREQGRSLNVRAVSRLDVMIVLFILLAVVSTLLPNHLVPLTGRLYGLRDLSMPFAAYAVGRLCPLTRRDLRLLVGLVALDVVVMGLGAIGERVLWGHGLLAAVQYGVYLHVVLGQTFGLPGNTPFTFYTDGFYPRAGSLAVGPLDLSVLLVIALPVLLSVRVLRNPLALRARKVSLWWVAPLAGVALVLAWGRESLVLAFVELALVLALVRPRWQWQGVALSLAGAAVGGLLLFTAASFVSEAPNVSTRIQVSNTGLLPLLGAAGKGTPQLGHAPNTVLPDASPAASTVAASTVTAAATPAATSGTGAGDLLTQSLSQNNTSTVRHLRSLEHVAGIIARHPQGYGIGTAGQVGNRFSVANVGGETAYLKVGVELGMLGLALYLLSFGGAAWAVWRVAFTGESGLTRAVYLGVAIAWVAILLDGIFAEVTLNLFAMYVLWWMAGAAVSARSGAAQSSEKPGDSGVR